MTDPWELPARYVPAPDFPVYGLAEDWSGTRGLDWICGIRSDENGYSTEGLWLGHHQATAGVRVGRFRWADADRAARTGVAALIDLTLPNADPLPPLENAASVVRAATHLGRAQATQHSAWPRMTWVVDGVGYEVPVWSFRRGVDRLRGTGSRCVHCGHCHRCHAGGPELETNPQWRVVRFRAGPPARPMAPWD